MTGEPAGVVVLRTARAELLGRVAIAAAADPDDVLATGDSEGGSGFAGFHAGFRGGVLPGNGRQREPGETEQYRGGEEVFDCFHGMGWLLVG